MTATKTKADLLLVPGKLVMVAAVKDAQNGAGRSGTARVRRLVLG